MNTNYFDVTEKIVLITGSNQGIGFSIARGFAQAGSRIILNGRNDEKIKKSIKCLKEEGLESFGYAFDVCNEKEVQKQIALIEEKFGQIDVLVNNAGIQIRGSLENFLREDWNKILNTNVTGAFLVSKEVGLGMIKRNAGKIINICSIQSELARPSIAPYTASKGALKMLTKGMATDWGKYNIQVNGIAPGYFKTEMTKSLYENEQFNSWLCNRTPANRWGETEELIGAAIFLASRASDYINGQILFVDGGMSACV
jgi:gluconate 5-dehydrogenase